MTDEFIRFLDDATKVVESWPVWKQNVLGRRAEPPTREKP